MSQSKQTAYTHYIATVLKNGGRALGYLCPACESPIMTETPLDDDEVMDRMTACPFCEVVHLKMVSFHSVRAIIPSGAEDAPSMGE
nr:hypothetical protein [uncultured Halomonas sp.]